MKGETSTEKWLFNATFAESRGITGVGLWTLQGVYKQLHQVLKRPSMHTQSPKHAVAVIEALETTLQGLWGFPYDKDFHSYWMDLRGCTCAKMDNRERMGTKYKVITMDCPYHGSHPAQTWEDKRLN